jgi:hypothetical protein
MKFRDILIETTNKIEGTNCANCKYAHKERTKVSKSELDPQGGLKITNKEDLRNAKHSDLVTLPGKGTVTEKFYCEHKDIKQFVTERMCCAYWDATGTLRAFGKKSH